MFRECGSLTSFDISIFNLPKVEILKYMLMDCINFKYINMALVKKNLIILLIIYQL
jgi:surface protein